MWNIHTSPRLTCAAVLYGAGRRAVLLRDACVMHHGNDGKTGHAAMLLSSKTFAVVLGGLSAPYLWPVYLHRDLRLVEIQLRGFSPEQYGLLELTSDLEHVFMT